MTLALSLKDILPRALIEVFGAASFSSIKKRVDKTHAEGHVPRMATTNIGAGLSLIVIFALGTRRDEALSTTALQKEISIGSQKVGPIGKTL